MNGEEYKYLVINTAACWREGTGEGIRFSPDASIALASNERLVNPPNDGRATGLAVDRDGVLHVIDAQNCLIYKYRPQDETFKRIPCIGACGSSAGQFRFAVESPPTLGGWLAFGKSTLYVADTFNHRVQAFHLRNLRLRFILGAQGQCKQPVSGKGKAEFNQPKDIVVDSKGNIYVLDYGNNRIQKFDRYGRFRCFVGEGKIAAPENIAIALDNSLYVIDAWRRGVLRFDGENSDPVMIPFPDELESDFQPSGLAVDGANLIYVGQRGDADLSIHVLDPSGRYLGHFGNYAGACYQLVCHTEGIFYANCGLEGGILLLEGNSKFVTSGVYYSKMFDSADQETQWHRLVLDTEIAERSTIAVSYAVSNHGQEVSPEEVDWQPLLSTPHGSVSPKEGLFADAKGQYMRLKIELFGDEYHTPIIRGVKVFFPRLSYLRYLPATYQDDEIGRTFLERFLSLFESVNFDMEQTIAETARYLDPRATDKAFLDWLAGWLAIAKDESWSEQRKRKFIGEAYQLYKYRGTPKGLKDSIAYFLGPECEVRVLEHARFMSPMILGAQSMLGFSTRVGKASARPLIVGDNSTIGEFALTEEEEPPEAPFAADAFDFTVMVDTSKLSTPFDKAALQRLIEGDKPAHTRYFLRMSEGEMQLGLHALVGVDTIVARGLPMMRLGTESVVGVRAFVGTREARGTIGVRSRIAVDTILY